MSLRHSLSSTLLGVIVFKSEDNIWSLNFWDPSPSFVSELSTLPLSVSAFLIPSLTALQAVEGGSALHNSCGGIYREVQTWNRSSALLYRLSSDVCLLPWPLTIFLIGSSQAPTLIFPASAPPPPPPPPPPSPPTFPMRVPFKPWCPWCHLKQHVNKTGVTVFQLEPEGGICPCGFSSNLSLKWTHTNPELWANSSFL